LKWAREHGCPWDALSIDAADESGCAETIKYVSAEGCPSEYLYESHSDDDDDMEEDDDDDDESESDE